MWGLGLLELVLLSVFVVASIIAITFDRKGHEEVKWWTFVIGLVVLVFFTWSDWTFAGVWEHIKSPAFWGNVGIYLGIGLVYSLVEFTLAVRRAARYYAIQWGRAKRTMPETADAQSVLRSFINSTYTPKDAAFVKVVGNTNNLPEPKIDKEELTAHVGAWTFWWPAYAVSLILGDLLTEVFRVISDFLITISGRFVNMAFKGVFK